MAYSNMVDPHDYFDPRHPQHDIFWEFINPFLENRFRGSHYFANSDPAEDASTDSE